MNERRKRLRQRMRCWAFFVPICISYPLAGSASGAPPESASFAEQCRAAAAIWTEDGPGIAFADIDPKRAVPVCEQAVAENPADGDLKAYLCRALNAAKEPARAREQCRAAAAQGSAAGMFSLGTFFDTTLSRDDDRDDAQALAWYRQAAEQGYAPAQNNLGSMYGHGRGVEQSATEAVAWYRKAAEQGYAHAQNHLGVMYENGRGVEQSATEAVAWYRKAAEQGYAHAQTNLGLMYMYGRGVKQSDTEAVDWYRKAAAQGDATAQTNLGWMYEHGLEVEHSDTEAVAWYRKAAEQGDATAQTNLGSMYEHGSGVEQSDTEAVAWYRKATEQGDAGAQNYLGMMYAEGRGVEQSDTEAMAWFVKSAATYAADDKQPKSGILVWLRAASRVKNPDNQVQLVVLALCQATSGTDKFGSIDAYGNVSRNLLLLRTVEGVAPTRDAVFAALERLEVARKNYFQGAFELYGQPGYFPQHLKTGVHHLEQALSQGLWEAGFHLLAYYKSVGEAGAWLNTLHRMHALLSSNWDDEKANAVITRLLAKISIPENLIPDNDMGGAFTPADASQQDLYALAGSGLSYAQYLLGRRLLVQETDPDRVQEGLRWVEQAAQGGAEEAQLLLATHYLEGRGVPQDDTKALEWLQRAVRQGGSPEPYYRLGILYENGQGVARNDEVALTWYRRASGYVPAMLAERFWSAQQGGAGPESSTLVAGLIALQRWYPLVSPELPDFLRSHAWLRSFDALEWREALTKLDAGFAQLVEGVLVSDGILLPRDTRKGVLLLEGALREGYIDAGIELLKLYRMEDAPQQWARIAGDVMRLARRHERPKILWELLAEVTKDQIPPNEALPPHAHLLPWRPLYQALAKKGWPYAQRITQWLGAAPLVGDGEASGQGESDAIPSDQPRRAAMPRHVPVESVTEAAVSGAWQDEIAELEGKLERLHNDLFSEPYINYETINDISSKTYHLALLYLASGDQDKLIDLAVRQLAAVRAAHIGEEGRDDGFFGLLSESCHWSRYGSILYTAGLPEASLFFYKQSVNRLQQARPYLKDFPVPVRECFLKYYEERYRQLADLFIEQGHLAEAEFVIGLLKDNEVAEFVRGANGAGDKTLAQLPLTAAEATLQSAFNAMHQDLFAENRRLAELRNKKKAQGELSEEERREIEALQALVRDGGRVFGEHMRGIKDRFAALERKENAWTAEEIDASLGSVRVTLKKLAQGGAGEVVAIHTVVLADGIHLLVSNRDTQVARFSPVNRNELIGIVASLRQALATPYWDPTPSARRLYEVLIAPILADIQGAQATTLVWSLDHILRYVPLAVLHDGEHHLFQKYQLAMLTNASRDRLVTTSPQEFEIGGFGVSAAGRGFDELRFVPLELDGIVKKSDDDLFGVAPGNYWLDSDFTKNELELALPEYPIIHIASHFSLTPGSYDKSFLLLGDGSDLSLKEIVDYRMDFSGVDLLVLSACSTALGGADMDGGEVQSFAEIAHGYGASSIIATLWPVADASTSLFMQEFYRRQGGGQSKAQALQAVQEDFLNNRVAVTATLRDRAKARGLDLDPVAHVARPAGSIYPGYSHPYYWAPFVLMGNWL